MSGKVSRHDQCDEEDDDDIFVVDCDVRVEQNAGTVPFVRQARKTTVTFSCSGERRLET